MGARKKRLQAILCNFRSILGLQEMHAIGFMGDRDAEEVVKVDHVRHGKFKAERDCDPIDTSLTYP
jgi:hypothetical protein